MKRFVAANWKMNGSLAANEELLRALIELPNAAEQVICPPAVYLSQVSELLSGTDIAMGIQNVDWHESGAFTGEVSTMMAKDLGCRYVIVGHSERRTLFDEDDAACCEKARATQSAGLTPIFCIGESKAERDAGKALDVVKRQLVAGLDGVSLQDLVLAYEPVWAIGTGDTASPEQAGEVHDYIRRELENIDKSLAQTVRILYGGSVKADNAASLFAMENIDGALVGGASLNAKEFSAICCA